MLIASLASGADTFGEESREVVRSALEAQGDAASGMDMD
jgi:hypothetical protein